MFYLINIREVREKCNLHFDPRIPISRTLYHNTEEQKSAMFILSQALNSELLSLAQNTQIRHKRKHVK